MTSVLLAAALLGQLNDQSWSVNPNGSILWGSQAYLPVGLRIDGDPELIKAAADAGIQDVIVDLPAEGDWSAAIEALKAGNLRYIISISSMARNAQAYQIEPERLRRRMVPDDGTRLTLRLPGLKNIYAASVAPRDNTVRWSEQVAAAEDQAVVDFKPAGVQQDLILFPCYEVPASQDLWEGLDSRRDQLLIQLKSNDFGPGLRGLLNPMGRIMEFAPDGYWVPDSKLFRLEMESFLQQKYGSPATVRKAWSLGVSDLGTYSDLARIIPLWSAAAGPDAVFDPETGRYYRCDSKESTIWTDIHEVIRSAMSRRYDRLTTAIRSAVNVPVIQDWAGWDGPYGFVRTGLSGVGFSSNGPLISDYVDDGSYAAASALGRTTAIAALATSLAPPAEDSRLTPEAIINETEGMGVRGWFFQADKTNIARVAESVAATQIHASVAGWRPKVLPFSDATRNPCFAGRVVGGSYWLPSPGSGSRLELGPGLRGYRHFGGDDQFIAIWSTRGTQRIKFQITNPERLTYSSLSLEDPDPRIRRTEVEVTVSEVPLLIRGAGDMPAFTSAFDELQAIALSLLDMAGAKADPGGGERYQLMQAVRDFKTEPSRSLFTVQDIVKKLSVRAAPFLWIEAERTEDTNWSARVQADGASNGAALLLNSLIPELSPFEAAYDLNVKAAGSYEVWVAASGSDAALEGLRVQVGGEVLQSKAPTISRYGPKLGWLNLGRVELTEGNATLRLGATVWNRGKIMVDAIVVSPNRFQPSGPNPPLDWLPIPAPTPAKG